MVFKQIRMECSQPRHPSLSAFLCPTLLFIDLKSVTCSFQARTDYITLFSLQNTQEQPLLEKQKHNLEQYERRYGMLLWHWFMVNMTRAEQNLPPMWPLKSDDTYRLYDRGTIYAKTDTFEKVVDNSGIVKILCDDDATIA